MRENRGLGYQKFGGEPTIKSMYDNKLDVNEVFEKKPPSNSNKRFNYWRQYLTVYLPDFLSLYLDHL